MKNRLIVSIWTKNDNDIETAARQLAFEYNGKQVQFDTVVFNDLSNSEVTGLIDELLSKSGTNKTIFGKYGIVINGFRVDRTELAKNELFKLRKAN